MVVDLSFVNLPSKSSISVVRHDRADRLVDGNLGEVDSESRDLSIEVGEVSTLEQRIVGEVDSRDDVLSAESDLLGLGEVLQGKENEETSDQKCDETRLPSPPAKGAHLVDVSVQLHSSNVLDGDQLLGPELGSVENIERELVFVLFRDDLDSELPGRVRPSVDGVVEIPSVKVGILSVELRVSK